jgi:hypothetical protein
MVNLKPLEKMQGIAPEEVNNQNCVAKWSFSTSITAC